MDAFTEQAAALYQAGMPLSAVASEMKTSSGYVSRKLRAGGISPQHNTKNYWTPAEDAVLRENYGVCLEILSTLITTRTVSAIKNRISSLGLVPLDKKKKLWTDSDYAYIEENVVLTDYALAKELGVTGSSVKAARGRLGQVKKYLCRVCGAQLSQQGEFCKEHAQVGRQMRSYSSKAMVKGREFSLTEDETFKLLTSNCTYCGGEGYGIDRIDSSKGYVQGNVTACCTRCNIMKNDMTVKDFEAHIQRVATHIKEKS